MGRVGAGLPRQVGKGCSGVRGVERDVQCAPCLSMHTRAHRHTKMLGQVLVETSGASRFRRPVLLEV